MHHVPLFPFADYWWFYLAFTAFVGILLALDLGLFHRKAHSVSMREASGWTVVWVTLAGLFAAALYFYVSAEHGPKVGRQLALEFVTGYVIEEALSVDNIFVFVLLFQTFAIPPAFQHRILFYGIVGAIIFRGIFIALGSVLFAYHWVAVVFGIFLIVTGIKLLFSDPSPPDPENSSVLKFLRRYLPVTRDLREGRFVVREHGKTYATPLLLALVFIEMTDVLFAADSVPAIFAITREPMIVFTSNIFAILGLRSLYFLLAGALEKFHLLRFGLATVLVFVGLKMAWLNEAAGGKFSIGWSLTIIAGSLGLAIVASLLFPLEKRPAPDEAEF